jgi:large repetitive protein
MNIQFSRNSVQPTVRNLRKNFLPLLLAVVGVLAGQASFGATYTSSSTSGAQTWSSGTGWSAVPVSAVDTSLAFTATLASATVLQSVDDLVGDFLLNNLSMSYAGPTTGTGPTFTLTGGNLVFTNNGATAPTLSFNGTGTFKPIETINNAIILGNTVTLSAPTAGTTNNLAGVISGVGGISKSGSGAVNILGGANSFSGAVSIGSGALYVANIGNNGANSSLGTSGTITVGGGSNAGELRTTNTVSEATDKTIVMGGSTGGATIANYGTSTTLTLNGNIQANSTSAKGLTLNDKSGSITVNGVIANDVSGNAVSLVKSANANTVTLNASNGYTAGTTISAGTLAVGNSSALGTGPLTASGTAGATLMANSNVIIANNIANNLTGTSGFLEIVSVANITNTITGLISGTGGVRANKANSRTDLLNVNNSFSGGLKVQQGTFAVANMGNAGSNSAIGTSGTVILGDTITSGTLRWGDYATGNEVSDKAISLATGTAGGGVIDVRSSTYFLTLNGNIDTGTGTGKTLSLNANGQSVGLDGNTNTLVVNGLISGNAGVKVTGSGNLTMTIANMNNSFVGGLTIAGNTSGKTYKMKIAKIGNLGANSPIGTSGTINIGTATADAFNMLTYTGSGETTDKTINMAGTVGPVLIVNNGPGTLKFNNPVTISAAGAKTFYPDQDQETGVMEFAGNIPDSSAGATTIKKAGAGKLVLSASNSFTGGMRLAGGTLELKHANSLAAGNYVKFESAATNGAIPLVKVSYPGNGPDLGNLQVVVDGTINLGTDPTASIRFATANTWTAGKILTVANSTGGGKMYILNSAGLDLSQIKSAENPAYLASLDANGLLTFTSPLPVAPSALSYASISATVGSAITSVTPTVTGTVDSYSISTALPAGLSFNTTTGVISGTPTVASASATYTVTATNAGGNTTATVTFAVLPVAPSALSYASISATVGSAITSVTPTVTGTVDSYSISTALPAGLSFNTTTGVISGTPTVASASATYTVMATNAGGNTIGTVTVVVVPAGSTYGDWLGVVAGSDAAFWDYVYGATAPGALSASLKPTTAISGGNLVLTYYVRQNTRGLTVTAKTTADLAAGASSWGTAGVNDVAVGSPITVNGVSVQQRTASVAASGGKKFLKLEGVQAQ